MSPLPDAPARVISFMDRVREKERARTPTAKTDEIRAAPGVVAEHAATPTAKTDETLTPRPAFRPGPPYFEQIAPNTWIETAWARERCIRCPRPLAPGDAIYCPDHRYVREGAML